MRMKQLIPVLAVAALAALCASQVGAQPQPGQSQSGTPQAGQLQPPVDAKTKQAQKAIAAKQAEVRQVLAEIAAIDEELNMVSEQYDGARYKLWVLRKRLAKEQVELGAAKARYARAEKRAAQARRLALHARATPRRSTSSSARRTSASSSSSPTRSTR